MNDAVLVLSGLDPCGGAGISADIETINQFGLTSLPIVTTITVQNTGSITEVIPIDTGLISKQFYHLQDDIDFNIVKIGLLGDKQIKTIANLVRKKTIVLDPVITASTQESLLSIQAISLLKHFLLPLITIITPNMAELQALSGEKNEQKAIKKLGCEWTLLTTTDISDLEIEHRLYQYDKLVAKYTYTKLPGDYHGSGCTLSSAIASLLTTKLPIKTICQQALDYTYKTLLTAKSIGKMQFHPNRQAK